LNISLPSFLNRESGFDLGVDALPGRFSTINTAVPAEYASEGAADTLE